MGRLLLCDVSCVTSFSGHVTSFPARAIVRQISAADLTPPLSPSYTRARAWHSAKKIFRMRQSFKILSIQCTHLAEYQALGVGLRGWVKSAAEIWRTIARAGNDVTSREWRHSWGRHTGGTSHCWKTIVSMTSCQCRALFYVMYSLPWRYEYSWCAT